MATYTKTVAANVQSVTISGGGVWQLPYSINANDGDKTYADISSGGAYTDILRGTGYGFAIPANEFITGIKIYITANGTSAEFTSIRVLKGSNPVGRDFAAGSPVYVSGSTLSIGANNDTWGTNWTPAEINNAGFGFQLQADNITGGGSIFIDAIVMEVTTSTTGNNIFQDHKVDFSYTQIGNSAFDQTRMIHQITNNSGTTRLVKGLIYRWKAVYTVVGGGKDDDGTLYDRTGNPWDVKLYATTANAMAGTNIIQTWTGTLLSRNRYYTVLTFDTPYSLANGASLVTAIRSTGTAGSGEPGFMDIASDAVSDANQATMKAADPNPYDSFSAGSQEIDYQIYDAATPPPSGNMMIVFM